jgi:tetratricopeptide (TPR) repeat protein
MPRYFRTVIRRRAAALGVVFALKLLVLFQLRDHPLLHPNAGLDTTAYVQLALRVLAGDLGLGPRLYFVSPFYIYFLAAGLAIFDSFTAVRVIQILLGTASVACIFFTTKAWFGQRAGWFAAILAALTGLFTFYEVLILQSSIDAFFTSAALLALTLGLGVSLPAGLSTGLSTVARSAKVEARSAKVEARSAKARIERKKSSKPERTNKRRAEKWWIVAGVIFGLATLNRPNMLFGAAAVIMALAIQRLRSTKAAADGPRSFGGRIRPAALLIAGLLAGMAPAAIRNVVVARQWSFISSHGGLNFYIGNGEGATGFYRLIPGINPTIGGQEKDARRVAEAAVGRPLSDAETSDYFFGLAWNWVREHPADAAALFARKLAYVFNSAHVALPHSYPFYAHDERTMLRFYAIGPWLLIPLGLVGLVFAAPRTHRAAYLVWASFVPGYAAGVAAFFVAERYRLPLLVPLCVGAGAAIDRVVIAVTGRRTAQLAMPAIVFVALFAAVNWPLGLHDGRWEEGLRTAQRLAILQKYDEADDYVRRFEPSGPHPGATHYGVGAQLLLENQPERALHHLTKAQQLASGRPEIAYAFGQALLKTGRAREAIPHLRRGFSAGIALPLGGYDLALALQTAGDNAAAVEIIKRIGLPQDESDPEAWLRLGRLATRAQAPDLAEGYFQRAVQMRPDLAGARQQYGLNLLVRRRYDDAARELAEAVRLDPRDADSLAHLAYCELQLGQTQAAIAHMEAALAVDAQHPVANQLRAAVRHIGR